MATGCFLNRELRHHKGEPHGARHGKTEAQKEHFIVHNARKRYLKKKFEGVHDRFFREYRDSQLKIGWTEETFIAMDKPHGGSGMKTGGAHKLRSVNDL